MALGTLWGMLSLDTSSFRLGLNQSERLSEAFSKRVAQQMRNSFFGALSPMSWFQRISSGVGQAMGEIQRQTQRAQGAALSMGVQDIPLDAMTKMVSLSERIGVSMEEMVKLWRDNTAGAKAFREAVGNLPGGAASTKVSDIKRGWDVAMEGIGRLADKYLAYWAFFNPGLRGLRRVGRGAREADERAAQFAGPELGPGNLAGMKELLALRERSSVASFSLGRPDTGGLARIGGFTSAAGMLAQTHARTQTQLLQIIANNTRLSAEIARQERGNTGLP